MTTNNNDETKPKPKSWWKRKEIIGGCGLVILNVAASPLMASLNPWVFIFANASLGLLTVTGIAQGVEANNLKPTKQNYKIGE